VVVVVLGTALVYAMRPPSIAPSGQPDPFTVWTAIVVGSFLIPILGLVAQRCCSWHCCSWEAT
jgi:hypothetical protein